jgi:hypothetical protein
MPFRPFRDCRGFLRLLLCLYLSSNNNYRALSFLVGANAGTPPTLSLSPNFASPLQDKLVLNCSTEKNDNSDETMVQLRSQCMCGKARISFSIPKQPPSENKVDGTSNTNNCGDVQAVDCHCPACRKFHIAAFGSYVLVPAEKVQLGDMEALQSYTETCQEIGPVERLFCRHCYSKMATRPVSETKATSDDTTKSADEIILVNMGGLIDKTIPKGYQNLWRKHRNIWQQPSQSCWTKARPPRKRTAYSEMPVIKTTKGSCSCGQCQYEMRYRPYELQHCYCHLCRQFSGCAFQTWIPSEEGDFRWTTSPAPLLKETTDHGKRHVCTNCGGVLTIVYNDDPTTTWPAAGGLDDATLPATREDMSQCLGRVCHICCKWKQSWYSIPNDGLERIQYAC